MADKTIFGCAETGTYQTSAPNPHIDLSGVASDSYSIAQLFADAMSSNETATVSVIKDKDNWAVYSGAKFTNDTVDTLDLSVATLLESKGTLSDEDTVTCLGLMPGNKGNSACSVYRGSAYTSVSTTETQFPYDTVYYDTGSMWDSENLRISPKIPGYYLVVASISHSGTTTQQRGMYLYKSGNLHSFMGYTTSYPDIGRNGSAIVYCNGVNDYLTITYKAGGASAIDVTKEATFMTVIGPLAA